MFSIFQICKILQDLCEQMPLRWALLKLVSASEPNSIYSSTFRYIEHHWELSVWTSDVSRLPSFLNFPMNVRYTLQTDPYNVALQYMTWNTGIYTTQSESCSGGVAKEFFGLQVASARYLAYSYSNFQHVFVSFHWAANYSETMPNGYADMPTVGNIARHKPLSCASTCFRPAWAGGLDLLFSKYAAALATSALRKESSNFIFDITAIR